MGDPRGSQRVFGGMPRRFVLERFEDVSAFSGTGTVVWGVEFPDGRCAYRWNSPISTTVIADSFREVEEIHGHDGATRLRWLDEQTCQSRSLDDAEADECILDAGHQGLHTGPSGGVWGDEPGTELDERGPAQ